MTDLQELNLDDLNPFEGDASILLAENPSGFWKGLIFDPTIISTTATQLLALENNQIVLSDGGGTVILDGVISGSGLVAETITTSFTYPLNAGNSTIQNVGQGISGTDAASMQTVWNAENSSNEYADNQDTALFNSLLNTPITITGDGTASLFLNQSNDFILSRPIDAKNTKIENVADGSFPNDCTNIKLLEESEDRSTTYTNSMSSNAQQNAEIYTDGEISTVKNINITLEGSVEGVTTLEELEEGKTLDVNFSLPITMEETLMRIARDMSLEGYQIKNLDYPNQTHEAANLQCVLNESSAAESRANDYADLVASTAETNAKNYADSKDVTTLNSANTYTNTAKNEAITEATNLASQAESNADNYADTGDIATLNSSKSYADTVANTAKNEAIAEATTLANQAETNADDHAEAQDAITLNSANATAANLANQAESNSIAHSNTQDTVTLNNAKNYADSKDVITLNSAKDYTDSQLSGVENAPITAIGDVTGTLKANESNSLTIANKNITLAGDVTASGSLGSSISTTIADKSITLTGDVTGSGDLGGIINCTVTGGGGGGGTVTLDGAVTGTGAVDSTITTTLAPDLSVETDQYVTFPTAAAGNIVFNPASVFTTGAFTTRLLYGMGETITPGVNLDARCWDEIFYTDRDGKAGQYLLHFLMKDAPVPITPVIDCSIDANTPVNSLYRVRIPFSAPTVTLSSTEDPINPNQVITKSYFEKDF